MIAQNNLLSVLINGNKISFLYYTNCFNLSKIILWLLLSNRAQKKEEINSLVRLMILHFNTLSAENRNTPVSQKRVQNYCFYFIYANI